MSHPKILCLNPDSESALVFLFSCKHRKHTAHLTSGSSSVSFMGTLFLCYLHCVVCCPTLRASSIWVLILGFRTSIARPGANGDCYREVSL